MRFPFWLVMPVKTEDSAPQAECGAKWLPLTFSAADKMTSYLSARNAGQWEVRLVNRYSATAVLSELNSRGCAAVCHDVAPDGSGGATIPLVNVLENLDGGE